MKNWFNKVMLCLLVLGLVASIMAIPLCASAATKTTEVIEIVATDYSEDGNRFQFQFSQGIRNGDVITFFIKPYDEFCGIYVRDLDNTFTGETFGDEENVISVGDGWYAVKAVVEVYTLEGELNPEYFSEYWAVKLDCPSEAGDKVYIRDVRINGIEYPNDATLGGLLSWFDKPAIEVKLINLDVEESALDYTWPDIKEEDPVNGGYEQEIFNGTLPTYDTAPYTWKVNSTLGAQNLPAVNLAATGRYPNVTNINDDLIKATLETQFVDVNNMIFIISDGLGQNGIKLSEFFGGNLILNNLPYYGTSSTLSFDLETGLTMVTTDSAAGGTALASGIKTRYSYEGLDVDGNDVPQITEVLREKFGKIIGVVTTGWAYDATPATYGGAHAIRGESEEIATEMLTFAPDLFIGQGVEDYESVYNTLSTTVLAGQNIGWYTDWSQAVKATHDKMWINTETDVRYTDDFSTTHPTISQMMAYSLTWLQAKSDANDNKGFFLMFENGMTDDAGHDNNAEAMIGETQATDEAVAIALKFACENPDTIVIVTADHDTGGLILRDGWERNIKKALFSTTGHSQQEVAVYAVGKGADVFDGQQMYNTQVGKVTAHLMGITTFGTTDATYDIGNILAGIKNEISVDVDTTKNLIADKLFHARADKKTDKIDFAIGGLDAKAHDMITLVLKVPAGATSVKVYGADSVTKSALLTQDLDKVLNYDATYDYYLLTVKTLEDFTQLGIEVTGDFAKGDEVWIDNVVVGAKTTTFEDHDITKSVAAEDVTIMVHTAEALPEDGGNDTGSEDNQDMIWIIVGAVVVAAIVAAVVVIVVAKKKK